MATVEQTITACYSTHRGSEKLKELMCGRRTPAFAVFSRNNGGDLEGDLLWNIRAVSVGMTKLFDCLEVPDTKNPNGNLNFIIEAIGNAVDIEERAVEGAAGCKWNPYQNFVTGPGHHRTQAWHLILSSPQYTKVVTRPSDRRAIQAAGSAVLHAIVSTTPEIEVDYDYSPVTKKRRGWVRWVGPVKSVTTHGGQRGGLNKKPGPDLYLTSWPDSKVFVRSHWRMMRPSSFGHPHREALTILNKQERGYWVGGDMLRAMREEYIERIPDQPTKPPRGSSKKMWAKYFATRQERHDMVRRGFKLNRLLRIDTVTRGYADFNLDYRGRYYIDNSLNYQSNKMLRACALGAKDIEYSHHPRHLTEFVENMTGGLSIMDIRGMTQGEMLAHIRHLENGHEVGLFMDKVKRVPSSRWPVFYDYKCSAFQIISVLTNDLAMAHDSGLTGHVDSTNDMYAKLADATGLSRDGAKALLTRIVYGAHRLNLIRLIRDDIHCGHQVASNYLDTVLHRLYDMYPGINAMLEWREMMTDPSSASGYEFLLRDDTAGSGTIVTEYRHTNKRRIKLLTTPERVYYGYRDLSSKQRPDKQRNGRALLPNLIHTIDSMVLTAAIKRDARPKRPTLWPIHDCLGGDAATMVSMREAAALLPTIVDNIAVMEHRDGCRNFCDLPATVNSTIIKPEDITGTIVTISS